MKKIQVKRYKVQRSIDEYKFPKEAVIHALRFDEKYIHVELSDQRIISIPLWWIPTVYNASMEDREKYEISQSRSMIIWNPDKCGINDEINIVDYLRPARDEIRAIYTPRESKRQVAETKSKMKLKKK